MKESKRINIAVFGGSFDPVHTAHIEIIKELSIAFDKVIVVPSFVSPFKPEGAAASAKHRKAMLKIALDGIENVTVSDYELKNGGTSYTADTVEYLMEKHKNAAFYLVIGTDLLSGLTKWKRFSELKKRVTFYVVGRENFASDGAAIDALIKKGVTIEISGMELPDVSSSLARASVAFNDPSLVSGGVFEYIKANKLYTDFNFVVDAYDAFELKSERRAHTFRTVEAGIALAKLYGGDVDKTILTLLLHDIGKYATEDVLKRNGLELTAKLRSFPAPVAHAHIGAYIAKHYFKIEDKSLLKAIECHTTGATVMDKLAKIVFLADAIESGRHYDGLDAVKDAAHRSLDAGMELALQSQIEHLESEGSEVYHPTRAAYEKFVDINRKSREKAEEKTVKTEKKGVKSEKNSVTCALGVETPAALAQSIAALITSKKGKDTVIIDVAEKTIIADHFVISSVTSTTAVKAITDYVDETLSKNCGVEPLRRDVDAKWAAIDYGSVIVHIQTEEIRKFYDLQRLWSDGLNVRYIKD